MKLKVIFAIILTVVMLLVACGPQTNTPAPTQQPTIQPQTAPTQNPTITPKTTPTPTKTDIVYVTNSGEKYHRAGCRYLSKSQIPMGRSEAISGGYTPCSVCRP